MRAISKLHDFLSALPPEGVEAFNRLSNVRRVAKGAPVYLKGDDPTEVYRVVSGRVRLCNVMYDGREVVTADFMQGDCFGEMGVIDGLPRVSDAVAMEDTELRVLSRSGFRRLLSDYPEVQSELLLTLCRRMRVLYAVNEEVHLSPKLRLARALHRLSFSHGSRDSDQVSVAVSQEELARMLSLSRQTVNRELSSLAREGLLKVSYGKVILLDLERLGSTYDAYIGAEQLAASYE